MSIILLSIFAFIITLCSTVFMSYIFRTAGGGYDAKTLDEKLGAFGRSAPEYVWTFFAATPMLIVSTLLIPYLTLWYHFVLYGLLIAGILLNCYFAVQTGHGVVLPWGNPIDDPVEHAKYKNRTQALTPITNLLARIFGIAIDGPDGLRSRNYCRLFMAVKGLWVGLSIFPFGLLLVFLWPHAYESGRTGSRLGRHDISELLAGAYFGFCQGLTLSALMFLFLL